MCLPLRNTRSYQQSGERADIVTRSERPLQRSNSKGAAIGERPRVKRGLFPKTAPVSFRNQKWKSRVAVRDIQQSGRAPRAKQGVEPLNRLRGPPRTKQSAGGDNARKRRGS